MHSYIGSLYYKVILSLLLLSISCTLHADPFSDLSIEEIEEEIQATQSQLEKLPLRLIRESGGTLGTRISSKVNEPAKTWVEVNLQKLTSFDSIALVPVANINASKEPSNHAFPEKFHIRIYDSREDTTGQLLFDSTRSPKDLSSNRTPVIIDCPGSSARRIRVIPLELHQNAHQYIFILSELLVFDGMKNVALGKPVSVSRATSHRPFWNKDYLTDGFMPYSQPSITSETKYTSCRIHIPKNSKRTGSVTLDLGSILPIDEVRLYPIRVSKNFARYHKAAMGFPQKFKIMISDDNSFRNSKVVFDTLDTEYPSPGLRLACFSANETNGRYVKIMAEKLPSHPNNSGFLMAFSEIEVLSKGKPVSYGVTVSSSHKAESNIHSLSMLVNGVCSSGKIIPIRSWLSDLSKRHKMERKHALLESTLQDRYLKQSNNAKRLKWGIGIALILALIVYFWQRQTRIHQMYRLRETLAADLHDEIGGNFSGIALLSDELAQENDMPQKHLSQLTSIGKISRDSAKNARALVRFLESRSVSGKLQAEMRSTAELLLKKHHYEFEVKGYHYVSKLSPKDKWHILLFFKETLNNIVKHADASKVDIKFLFDKKKLTLDITDNGRGLPSDNSQKPSHLAMRAKKLNANFDITSERDSGTTIHLEKKL